MDAIPNYLQIFLRMRPAAILLHGAAATNPRFKGTGCSGQWGSPKELRASGAPLRQAVDGRRLRRYMLAPKRPTPVRRRFKVTHSLRGRSAPGGMCVPGGWWAAHALCRLLPIMFHCSIRLKLEFVRDAAWRLKGRRERRRWRLRFWAVAMRACKRWVVFSRAFLISVDVWCSLRSAGGAIPKRTGIYFTGVGRRQPLTILKVSLRVTSSFFFYVGAPAPCWGSIFCSAIDECEGACSESEYVCELPRMNQQDDVEGYSLTPLCHVVRQCAIWRWVVCPVSP